MAKMKDGRTHLAHKCEQAVDLETEAVVAVTIQTTDGGDTASLVATLDEATNQLSTMELAPEEVVTDKGYHSNATMVDLKERKLRSYVSEPNRGRRSWKKNREAQQPTYANRRRIRGTRGKALPKAAGREGGTYVCAPAQYRRAAPGPCTGTGGDPEADAGPGRCPQPGAAHAHLLRGR